MTDYQVIIVGGGATGVGILRDLSMRGISVLLLEQGDLAHGTSSRFHGLLHSGARYAVKDQESAIECINENYILKRIAPSCITNTGGWFVQTKDDSPGYVEQWIKACKQAQIPIREISPSEAYSKEPLLKKDVMRVFEVPDATVDGFKIVWANAKSAKHYGGQYKTYQRVERIVVEDNRVVGVVTKNLLDGQELTISCSVVVNAAGAWAGQLANTIDVPLEVICDKGTLVAFNQRLFQRVVNRLRSPGDGDIFVPHETITILGTTSAHVNLPDENNSDFEEVKKLLAIGGQILPNLRNYRVLRAFAGVRPLYKNDIEGPGFSADEARMVSSSSASEEGRNVSRSFAVIDHEKQHGVQGFISIVGGKFTTYRLMAEKISDWVAKKLNNTTPCRTASENLLPEIPEDIRKKAEQLLPNGLAEKMLKRLQTDSKSVLMEIERDPQKGQLLCECEMITLAELEKVAADEDTHNFSDIRRKTRLGMGTCQGAFCTYRALPLLWEKGKENEALNGELINFLDQRWKGIRPILWGQQIRETELTRAIYNGILQVRGP